MKKVLVLGGTQFIGRNLVEQLQKKGGYDITLFNRQKTNVDLFPSIKKIKGDRETRDIEKLSNTDWDCVIDLSCYFPNTLQNLLAVLRGKVKRYVFISTLSVLELEEEMTEPVNEDFKIFSCDEQQKTGNTMATYGSRKAECERILQSAEWLDSVILRPSIVYGKYDPTDRFYYWLYKAKNQLPIILPDNGTDEITLTYVNDLVDIAIKAMEIEYHSTVYNVTTHQPISLKSIVEFTNRDTKTVNVSAQRLLDKGVKPGSDIPLWFNFPFLVSNERLRKDFGIDLTPFDQSVRDTMQYYQGLSWPKPKIGLDVHTENEILNS